MKFLVVGCGSIGQRHIRNLRFIGEKDIAVFDTNSDLSKKVSRRFHVKRLNSLSFDKIDCTLVCTTPNSHLEIAKKALLGGSHVFIEKPLSNSTKGVKQLSKIAKKSLKIQVGYVFRFDKGLQKVKELLAKNSIGKVISFDAYEGWYLPLWRPWQDYTKSYTGSNKKGGGIILDGSHELNYLLWLGERIKEVFCYFTAIPALGVKAEGLAEILLKFRSNAVGRIHLDFVNPKYNRHCEIIGERGSIRWFFGKKTIEIQKSGQSRFQTIRYGKDSNQMYVDEMKHLVDYISGKKSNMITLKDAVNTLEISLAIKRSGRINRPVSV